MRGAVRLRLARGRRGIGVCPIPARPGAATVHRNALRRPKAAGLGAIFVQRGHAWQKKAKHATGLRLSHTRSSTGAAESFSFETTAELGDLDLTVGQARALSALDFGTRMRDSGYNMFVLGRSGSQRRRVVTEFLERQAQAQSAPFDWCYLNNFDEQRQPIVAKLPAGTGTKFRNDMACLVEELKGAIPAAFDSEQYRTSISEINQELEERHRQAIQELQEEAQKHDLSLVSTPHGFAIAPTRNGEILSDEDFEKLHEDEKNRKKEAIDSLSQRLREHFEKLPSWQKERRDKLRALQRELTEAAAGKLIDELKERYAQFEDLPPYFDNLREDVLENASDFLPREAQGQQPTQQAMTAQKPLSRYEVNLVVAHGEGADPPIVYENNPSVQNLLGRVEHTAQFGALSTDFTMIRSGALHRANGGYLIIDAEKVLLEPLAWSALKRTLDAGEIKIESPGQMMSLVSTVSLEPEPVPIDLKVIVIGERMIYYLLSEYDSDFDELFKVAVDFENRIDRTPENTQLYGQLVANLARRENLPPLSRGAVARTIEHGARLLEDAEKLTTRLRDVSDLLREAGFWAREESADVVDETHVQKAIDSQVHRLDRVRSELYEEIQRNSILIDSQGEKVGQINALSVLGIGGFSFGQPSRVTATVRIGEGSIVDIERETELGGPLHSKGVLILSSYLRSKYATGLPLSINASLVFEQSYGGVEGDSASVAETCVLLSAIGRIPLKQTLAITGSVNQHGEVQVIGGVNDKIEGFFDICSARGLSGGRADPEGEREAPDAAPRRRRGRARRALPRVSDHDRRRGARVAHGNAGREARRGRQVPEGLGESAHRRAARRARADPQGVREPRRRQAQEGQEAEEGREQRA